jgi:8-oxo-dGTP diphosphatase
MRSTGVSPASRSTTGWHSTPAPGTPLHVAVAVIEDDRGRILLARRPPKGHLAGLWEFPGGKLEPSETLAQALQREVLEELGLRVLAHRPLIAIHHDYGEKQVLLDVHRVTAWEGVAQGREGQPLAWVVPDRLNDYPLPPADRPIVSAIRLPDCYLIASPESADLDHFRRRLGGALAAGTRLLQFRPMGLPREAALSLLAVCHELCDPCQARVLVSSRLLPWLQQHDPQGIHLTAHDLMARDQRPPGAALVAASCHSREELRQAEQLGLDFAVLSPVQSTASHPEALPLGWPRFAEWVAEARIPVYAMGGLGDLSPAVAWGFGAQGIAGIRGFW